MDWEKYNKVPLEFSTAQQIGLAAATLGAMARKGLVEVLDTSPKQYRKANSPNIKIYQLYEQHKTDYFIIYSKNKTLGMLCSMSANNTILDCWGQPYDLTNIYQIEFNKQLYAVEVD